MTVSKEMRNRVCNSGTPRTKGGVRRDIRNGNAYGESVMRYLP